MITGPHPSHVLRFSMDASSYDEICVNCGATDQVPGGWGQLAFPCPHAPSPVHAEAFREIPWDHNAECLYCDEQGEHDPSCPWVKWHLARESAACVCRTAGCGHRADHHDEQGSCRDCGKERCWS